ncbi:asparaginase [Paenibacillus sp. NEAU-GSW1]|uniref:asparaginase n=1 Tax=Paenibacillus sp. NEAU-GSW1 TaxID=2682486 RepID=UPI0012E1AA51|nr:asparaginase domain-containing protein [Paenibacillus sp. NEAU-GSW1]MUT66594.1 hypothetical protein [Paenibacillus sp. NEAU-GSW1]
MAAKQIAVLFTGGTIGSKNNNGKMSPQAGGAYTLIESYTNAPDRRDVVFDTAQPLNVLSENIVPDDWNTLMDALGGLDKSAYDGIIVTHGSDTLAYSAAMLSYLCCDTPVPIVLVAANYPLEDERSNGASNFAAAIDFIAGESLPGVFVVYRNDRGESIVYLGTRITQCESFTDQFGSPYSVPYGQMVEGRFVRNEHPYNPFTDELRGRGGAFSSPWQQGKSRLESGLLYIKPFSGIDYSYYDFSGARKPKAVLHDLYHSGTASANAPGSHSLLRFAEYCGTHGVDLYLCPLKDSSEALYASSVSLIEAGVAFIENMSIEAALTKLTLTYSLLHADKEEIRDFVLNTSLFYEHIVPKQGRSEDNK